MIPVLEQIIKRGGALGVQDIVIGMAHRGRLNVLVNRLGKLHRAIFHEFKGGSSTPNEIQGSGDVKYHLGSSSDREFDDNECTVAYRQSVASWKSSIRSWWARCAPSAQLGATREDRPGHAGAHPRRRGVCGTGRGGWNVSVCPDCAAIAPAARCISSSTTRSGSPPDPRFSRSSPYCTDVAKMVEAPIFHVNGDDPEALSTPIRSRPSFGRNFNSDVFIDLVCYPPPRP